MNRSISKQIFHLYSVKGILNRIYFEVKFRKGNVMAETEKLAPKYGKILDFGCGKGFFSAYELSKASIEDLMQIRDISEEKAIQLIEAGKEYILNLDHAEETSQEAVPEQSDDEKEISEVPDESKASEDQLDGDEDMIKQTILSEDKATDSQE